MQGNCKESGGRPQTASDIHGQRYPRGLTGKQRVTGNRVFLFQIQERILSRDWLTLVGACSLPTNLNSGLAVPLTAPSARTGCLQEAPMCPNAISAPVASLTAESHGCARQRSGHTVQFYSSDEFLLNELARLVGMSLATGDAAIVVATKQHREGLRDRLQAQGLDLDLAVKQQRYFPLDAADTLSTFMVDHQPDALP